MSNLSPLSFSATPSVPQRAASLPLGKPGLRVVDVALAREEALARAAGAPPPVAVLPRLPAPATGSTTVACSGVTRRPGQMAAPTVDNLLFDTGDPFVILRRDGHTTPLTVAQAGLVGDAGGIARRVVECLQTLWAARAAGAPGALRLRLPYHCDPARDASPFNRLLARLAKASGAHEIIYDVKKGDAGNGTERHAGWYVARLKQARSRDAADGIRGVAYGMGKQARRRGDADGARAWQKVCARAVRAATTLPAAAGGTVVFGVDAAAHLRAGVAEALRARGETAVGQHVFSSNPTPEIVLKDDVAGKDVVIVHAMRPGPRPSAQGKYADAPLQTLEALMLAQEALEAGARRVSIVQAYQLNARSDREEHTANDTHAGAYCALVARWFDAVKCDHAVLVESHDLHTPTYWSDTRHAHARVVDGVRLLVDDIFAGLDDVQRRKAVLALPDAGSIKRAKHLRGLFSHVLEGQKVRTTHQGGPTLLGMQGDKACIDPDGIVVLPDDETATGSTLRQTLAMLRGMGARHIHAAIVHNNLPLDWIERNLTLAGFCHAGAETVRFSDSHTMGEVVRSYADLLRQAPDAKAAARQVACWMDKAGLDITPDAFFQGLRDKVRIVPLASAIAQALPAPPEADVRAAARPSDVLQQAAGAIARVADFPKKGVAFWDMGPLLNQAKHRKAVVAALAQRFADARITRVVALESRGFILGAAVADALDCGLVMLRKPGKTPGRLLRADYALEYGEASVVLQEGLLGPQDRVLVIDDVIATGGTAKAAVDLVRKAGAECVGVGAMVEVTGLKGRDKLAGVPCATLFADAVGDSALHVVAETPGAILPSPVAPPPPAFDIPALELSGDTTLLLVPTANPAKIEALESAMGPSDKRSIVLGREVASGVSAQPYNDDGIQGAAGRTRALLQWLSGSEGRGWLRRHHVGKVVIGAVENYIDTRGDRLADVGCVLRVDIDAGEKPRIQTACTPRVAIPEALAGLLPRPGDTATFGENLARIRRDVSADDWHRVLAKRSRYALMRETFGRLSR